MQAKIDTSTERGQSLIEFAFSMVVLLILVVVIIDGARALFSYLSMRDAAQEGAAYASYQPTDYRGVFERICNASNMMYDFCGNTACTATTSPTKCGSLRLTVTPTADSCMGTSTGGEANGITVRIDYVGAENTDPGFPLTMPFVSTFTGSQYVQMHVTVTDTILSPQCP